MRIHRLKRRSSISQRNQQSKVLGKETADGAPLNTITSQDGRKRRNPFSCNSPSKRRAAPATDKENSPVSQECDDNDDDVVLSDSESSNTECRLFAVLNTAEQKLLGKADAGNTPYYSNGLCEQNGITSHTPQIRPASDANSARCLPQHEDKMFSPVLLKEKHERVPLDWSVKVKMRIVTQSPLDISPQVRSAGEVRAHVHFVQNLPLDELASGCLMSALQRLCSYWVHPNLPWFPEFPRIVPDSKIRKQVPGDVGQNEMIQKALYHDWMASFTAVFQQLKSGFCPYFYLCCHHFTVLFRGVGVGGYPYLTACLTPTTRGVREALKRDGIDFSMPNWRNSNQDRSTVVEDRRSGSWSGSQDGRPGSLAESTEPQSQTGSQESEQNVDAKPNEDGEDLEQETLTSTDEGASLWLEDMGLDKKSFPTLEPQKVKIQREGYQQVDRRAESLVFCEGCEVQALFNFLINCRSCTALTGPQAGIPPTILSPTSFVGATVKTNRIRHSVAKMSMEGETQDAHVLEIHGPLMPHHQLNIAALLRHGLADTAVISYNTHEPTAPFNMEATGDVESDSGMSTASSKLWEAGLHKTVRGQFVKCSALERGTVLHEVKCLEDGYTWSC